MPIKKTSSKGSSKPLTEVFLVEQLQSLESRLDAKIEWTKTFLESRIEFVRKDMREHVVSTVEGAVTMFNQRMDGFDKKMDTFELKVEALHDNVDFIKGDVKEIKGRLDRVETKLEEHDGRFDRLEQKMDHVVGKVDRHDEEIGFLKAQMA